MFSCHTCLDTKEGCRNMLNENTIFGHNKPVIPKHGTPHQTVSTELCSVYAKPVIRTLPRDGLRMTPTLSCMALQPRSRLTCLTGVVRGAALDSTLEEPSMPCTQAHVPHQLAFSPGTWRRILLGFKDLSSLGHPSHVTRQQPRLFSTLASS